MSAAPPAQPCPPPFRSRADSQFRLPTARQPRTLEPGPALPDTPASATVQPVVDGSTIAVELETGAAAAVRLIGVDTPETVDPRREVECFGREASARTRELLEGQRVRLERDVSQTDRFGRLLRYVWLDEATLINERLVAEGYARVVTFPPDVRYADQLLAAEQEAHDEGRGLWSAC